MSTFATCQAPFYLWEHSIGKDEFKHCVIVLLL